MTAINSLSQVNYIRNLINSQHDKLNELTRQSASGYKSERFSGLTINDSRVSIATRTEMLRAEAYKSTITAVTPRIQQAATTLDSIEGSLVEIRDTLLELNFEDGNVDGAQIRVAAEARFRQLVDRLNTKVDGVQIFAGRAGGTTGVGADYPIRNADTLIANFQAALGGPFANTAALNTAVDGFFGTTGAALTNWFLPGAVNGQTADPIKIADGQTIETGLTALPDASEPNGTTAFRDALASLAAIMTVEPADFSTGGEYNRFLVDQITKLNGAIEGVNTVVAKVGEIGEVLTEQKTMYADNDVNLKKALASAEEVDHVQVLSDLEARTTQLEATYKVTSQTRGLNLFNFI
ncbi:hypothetical protein ACFSM5_07415 [Lacibacterium aquatile]|uniref:Flagellin n=1 Tax=Lacibacterium aquatile TaxID=1168082 RepID=A0ABW5DNW3_9PROT